jgi:hypothetical protein
VREALRRIGPADVGAARRALVEIAQGLNVS